MSRSDSFAHWCQKALSLSPRAFLPRVISLSKLIRRADERTRTADLLITSEIKGVSERCRILRPRWSQSSANWPSSTSRSTRSLNKLSEANHRSEIAAARAAAPDPREGLRKGLRGPGEDDTIPLGSQKPSQQRSYFYRFFFGPYAVVAGSRSRQPVGNRSHPLAVVSRLPLEIYPILLHVVLPTTPIRARSGLWPRSYWIKFALLNKGFREDTLLGSS